MLLKRTQFQQSGSPVVIQLLNTTRRGNINIRKKRYDQRAYKYQDQERVPEFFEDIYDPIYDEFINEYDSDDWGSVDSFENFKIRYKRSAGDQGGVKEAASRHLINDTCANDETFNKY